MTQNKQKFQHLLFKVAFCTIACDGHIDEMEIEEMHKMSKSSIYFKDIELTEELENLLSELKQKGKFIIDDLYATLKTENFNTVQELLILEVAFRLAMANNVLDENEIKFIRFLRSHLDVHDEIIKDRFGVIEYLFDQDYSTDIVRQEAYSDILSSVSLSNLGEIEFKDLKNMI